VAARDLPITTIDTRVPIGRITINDDFEHWATRGMEFILSPILVAKLGDTNAQVIGFTIQARGAEATPQSRTEMLSSNHPVHRTIMGDNQVVKEL
jgi:hypothetical protein